MSVKIYLNSDNGLVIEEANGVIYNRTQGDLSAKSENGRIEFCYSASGARFKDYAVLDVANASGVAYGTYAAIISAISDFFVDAALAAAEQLEVDLGVEVQARTSEYANLQNQIDTVASGYLGAIDFNASSPTPGKNGYYEFSTGGVCAWIAGTPTVKVGDRVSVKYSTPSTYVYTHIQVDLTNTDLYNVTVRAPLAAGSYYTAATARAAVPNNIKKLGLKITYATAAGQWTNEQFIGSNVSGWAIDGNWVKLGTVEGDVNNRVTALENGDYKAINYNSVDLTGSFLQGGNGTYFTGEAFKTTKSGYLKNITISTGGACTVNLRLYSITNNIAKIIHDYQDIVITGSGTNVYEITDKFIISENMYIAITLENGVGKYKSTSNSGYFEMNGDSITASNSTIVPAFNFIISNNIDVTDSNTRDYVDSFLEAESYIITEKNIINNLNNIGTSTTGDKIWENQFTVTEKSYDSFAIKIKGIVYASSFDVYIHNLTDSTFSLIGTFSTLSNDNIQTININNSIPANCRVALYTTIPDLFTFNSSTIGLKTFDKTTFEPIENFSSLELKYDILLYTNAILPVKVSTQIDNALGNVDILKYGGSYSETNYTEASPFNGDTNFTISDNLYVNSAMYVPVDCTVTNIKGKFPNGNVLIYALNSAESSIRLVTTLVGDTTLKDYQVNIELLAGEALTSNSFYYFNVGVSNTSYKYSLSGLNISNKNGDTIGLSIGMTYKTINNITTIGLIELEDNTTEFIDNYTYSNNFIALDNQISGWTLSNFTLTNNTLISSTANAYCNLPKTYHTDKRYIRFDITINPSTTFIKIPCTSNIPTSGGEGSSCFGIDFINKKLIMYQTGDGTDTQYTSNGFTDIELYTKNIPNSTLLNNDYIIELHKNGLEHILILKNKTNCESVVLSHTGWGVGRQNEKYNLQLISGSVTIKSANVYAMNVPDIVFEGDSITEGVYVYDRTQRYAELFRTNNPHINVVISARGGQNINGILSKFANEYNIYRPKAMSVLIGANGGNTTENLNQLKAACDAINCKLYLNYRTAQGASSIDGNIIIAGLNLPGARFDIATSLNYNPSDGVNSTLYADGSVHPNILGNKYMYKRLSVDILDIFKKQ